MTHQKIAIIGAGSVGTAIAYAALLRGTSSEIALIDVDRARAEAHVEDLNHGALFTPAARISAGGIEDCAAARVVVVTAGAKQKPGQTRLDLAAANAAMFRAMIPAIVRAAPDALLLIVSNPVDVLTYLALKLSGLPEGRVFGSGTVLDSSRLRFLIAQRMRVAVGNVHAYIVGEHGDSEVPLWSTAQVGQVAIGDFHVAGHPALTARDQTEIFESVRTAAARIIAAKGATQWAIGLATTRILEAVLRDEQAVLPVSRLLTDYQGVSDVCLAAPSIVGARGVGAPLMLPLSDAERAGLRRSADVVRGVIDRIQGG